MDASTFFNEKLPKMLENNPDRAQGLGAVFAFDISGEGGGQWTADFKGDSPSVKPGLGEADCTISMESEDFSAMMENFSLAMQFFFTGKLRVEGDPMLATKLQTVFGG